MPATPNPRLFHLVSLGCAKNTVDSESMASLLQEAGFRGTDQPDKAGVLIVNTCGFIETARVESIQTLKTLGRKKRPGQILIAAGCLTERYRSRIVEEARGVDGFLGTLNWMDIVETVRQIQSHRSKATAQKDIPAATPVFHGAEPVRAARQGSSAYLKIADGCRRACAFCSIPLIKGGLVSRPSASIISDARALERAGVQELILIAQDTTDYARDLGHEDGITALLDELLPAVPQIPWVRLLYTFPGYVTNRMIDAMASAPQLLHYLDMPLQHADPQTLRRMNRPSNTQWVRDTIARMRSLIPDLALRTTFIVGYPGETETEFNTLLDFVREIEFDHVGAFTFSYEPGTPSEPLGDPVPAEVKEDRLARLMEVQQNISLKKNQALIGKVMPVLIEGRDRKLSIGRTYRDAPEIDGMVIVEGLAPTGQIVPVRITGAMTHDLTGVLA